MADQWGPMINAISWRRALWVSLAIIATGLVAIAITVASSPMASADGDDPKTIPTSGLEIDNEGAAGWVVPGAGPEPTAVGHDTTWTSCSEVALYYMASRDFVDGSSVAGLHAIQPLLGFPTLTTTLADNGYAVTDLTASWGVQDLGADLEGQDWYYDTPTAMEKRYYSGGNFAIRVGGEDIVGGSMPRMTIWIDYNDTENCVDDAIWGNTEYSDPIDLSGGSSPAAQNVAAAFLSDVGDDGIRFVFNSLQPATGVAQFSSNGRNGAYFEAQDSRIEAGSPQECVSCMVGVVDATTTHHWILRWNTTTPPTPDEARMKVVATTVNPVESGSILVQITDDSGPTSTDVIHPPANGDSWKYLSLDITPGTDYPFTVNRTGVARHYKLGSLSPNLDIGTLGVDYLEQGLQLWAVNADSEAPVHLEVITDTGASVGQATQVDIRVTDLHTGALVYESTSVPIILDTPAVFEFMNSGPARRLAVDVDANGHFRMAKLGGDQHFYILPCPEQEGPDKHPLPGLSVWGLMAMAGAIAILLVWMRIHAHRRQRVAPFDR